MRAHSCTEDTTVTKSLMKYTEDYETLYKELLEENKKLKEKLVMKIEEIRSLTEDDPELIEVVIKWFTDKPSIMFWKSMSQNDEIATLIRRAEAKIKMIEKYLI